MKTCLNLNLLLLQIVRILQLLSSFKTINLSLWLVKYHFLPTLPLPLEVVAVCSSLVGYT